MEVEEVGGGCGGCSTSRHRPRKDDVGSQRLDELRADSGHTVEPRQAAEQTMLLAPGDDALREGGPDAGETCDLRHVGAVEVDALAGQERSREPGGLPRGRGEPARGRGIHGHKSHVAGRRGFGGGERQSHTRAREGEEGEQEGGAAVVHGGTLAVRRQECGTRSTRSAPKERGSRVRNGECGVRNVSGSVAARLDLSFSIPHSALRIPHCYRTNATATSPTTWSDAALTLSIVSSVVCQYG